MSPPPLPSRRFLLGDAAVVASVAITLGLWVASMGSADAWHDDAWIYPAKVGSHGTLILMCWAFVLAARFRSVAWLFGGLDKVYVAHRRIGKTAALLILLHPICLALAFTDSAGGFFRYLWFSGDWVRNTGLIALGGFALLVVLSLHAGIAYHVWKQTHHFFGLLLVLVVVHGVMAGAEIRRFPVLSVWHGAWVVAAACAYAYIRVFYRFFGPRYRYVTESVEEIGDAITEIHLAPVGRPLRARPGQFVYVTFEADAVSREPHPFSISSAPDAPRMRLSIKRLGDWTADVAQIREGRPVDVWGAYGCFSEPLFTREREPAVMIGGGIGIAPFLSMVGSKEFEARSGETTLLYAVPDRESAVYRDELRERARSLPRLRLEEHYSDEMGFIDREFLEGMLERPLADHFFLLCGPQPMIEALRPLLAEAGVDARQIVVEEFDVR